MDCGGFKLNIGEKTYVMGVLNLTPDSFYSGSRYNNVEAAVSRARKMVEDGVDIIDVGGESTRPGSEGISVQEELNRVATVIKEIVGFGVPISIDTCKAEVARKALELGCSMVNDIYGLRGEGMVDVVREYDAAVVLMHMQGTPKNMQQNPQYGDVVLDIKKFFKERIKCAEDAGVKPDKIILDPGIGFGKTLQHNLEVIRRLKEFKTLGKPILIGPSRKSFIGGILDLPPEERLEGTLAAVAASIVNGADFVRVHDVREVVRAVRVVDAIVGRGVK